MPLTAANNGSLYVLDLADPHKGPRQLKMEGNYSVAHPDFTPHGISHWVTEDGSIYLYVVTHWVNRKDTVEIFQYYPDKESIRFVNSISDETMTILNDLVVLGKDEFYVTNYRYFSNNFLHTLEQFLCLPLTNVYHYKRGKTRTVATNLRGANGINKSRNGKSVG